MVSAVKKQWFQKLSELVIQVQGHWTAYRAGNYRGDGWRLY